MKKVKLAVITSIAGLSMAMSANASAMDKQTENALVEVCKSAASDKSYNMHKTINEFNLNHKTVALKVMCNGQDIIAFAESRGAERTAARLQRSIGDVDIIDVAAVSKINVTFKE